MVTNVLTHISASRAVDLIWGVLADLEMTRVHKDSGKLRSGTKTQWASAEVTERLLATAERPRLVCKTPFGVEIKEPLCWVAL